MITRKHLAAALGFAFAAAWIGLGFGDAVLCLLGAAVFYFVASFLEGDVDLSELQSRLGGAGLTTPQESAPSRAAPPRAAQPRPRVQ